MNIAQLQQSWKEERKLIEIYTDGSFKRGSNIGGLGVAALKDNKLIYVYSKQFDNVTNNQMELKAIIHACEIADKYFPDEEVIIYSDSSYCVRSITEWMSHWAKNNWINSQKEEVKNIELMRILYNYFKQDFYHCQIKWLKSHNGDIGNEIADALAQHDDNKFYKLLNDESILIGNTLC